MLDEEANISKVRYLHRKHGRICGRHKREGKCALPGEVCQLNDWQKSAEGIVPLTLPMLEGRPELVKEA